jgi:hypothetical protein
MSSGERITTEFPEKQLGLTRKVFPEVEFTVVSDKNLCSGVKLLSATIGENKILVFSSGAIELYPKGGPWQSINKHDSETTLMALRAILQNREGLL